MTSVTVNSAIWAEDTELDAQGKPVLDLGSWYQCEIKGGTSALYARLAHYIPFKDAKVEAVLLAKGVGDGLGITYKDAEKVTSISTWFQGNADITAFSEFVNFSGISTLLDYAFQNCTSLAEITLPASLTSIGGSSFNKCSSLTRVKNLENTKVTDISGSAFKDCTSLTEISLPDSLTSIGSYAFQSCKLLTRVVNLENTKVTTINTYAFYGCTSLAEINFHSSLNKIEQFAFYECSSLTKLNIPEGIRNLQIGDLAFYNCQSLSVINIISAISYLGRGAFSGVQLSGIVNFENLTEIGAYALRYTNVTKVIFPAIITLPAIYNYDGIFSYCPHLVLVDIGENCTAIGNQSFGRNVGLQGIDITLIVRANTPPTLGGSLTGLNSTNIGSIFVPDASVEAYKQATNWSLYADVIKPLSEYTE